MTWTIAVRLSGDAFPVRFRDEGQARAAYVGLLEDVHSGRITILRGLRLRCGERVVEAWDREKRR